MIAKRKCRSSDNNRQWTWLSIAVALTLVLSVSGTITSRDPRTSGGSAFVPSVCTSSQCCVACPSGEVGCVPDCTKAPPPCIISIDSTSVTYAGTNGEVKFGYTDSISGSGSVTADLQYTDNVTKGLRTIDPASNPQTLTGLNVSRVYSWYLHLELQCSANQGGTEASGWFWTATGNGGACPEGTPTVTLSSSTVTASDSKLAWTESRAASPSSNPGAGDRFYWGTSSSYGFTPTPESPPSESVYLQELEPSTTYYYEIVDSDGDWDYSCYLPGILTGSFTTQAASQAPTTFSGTVYDEDTGLPAPAGLGILALCVVSANWESTLTVSGGSYSMTAPACASPNVYWIELLLPCPYNPYGPGCADGTTWPGHWNETIITYVPGVVDFYAPDTYKTYVPSSAEFVHSSDAQISSYSTTIYTTTTASWDYGGNSGSTSTEAKYAWGTTSVPSGDSLLTSVEWYTSGTKQFNATDGRQTSAAAVQFYDQTGVEFSANGWSDWQTSAPSTGYCTDFNTATATFTLTLSGSVTVGSGYDFSVGLSAGPSWANAGVSIPVQSTLAATSGFTTSVEFTYANPDPGSYGYFLANTQGGSSSSSSSAIVAHVWLVSSC
jgi:hypothetical protein